jgi:S-DNA-T family DNA segregation ATPase FtsK/SpoIIIE
MCWPPLELLAKPKAVGRRCSATMRCKPKPPPVEGRARPTFGVRGEIINARPGPVVTLYELEPRPASSRRA